MHNADRAQVGKGVSGHLSWLYVFIDVLSSVDHLDSAY